VAAAVPANGQRQTRGRHHEVFVRITERTAVKAKTAEDAVAAAREEGREKLETRLADLRSSAERRQAELAQAATEARDDAASRRNELRSAVNAHVQRVKSDVDARKQASDVKRTERQAEWVEPDAAAAIGFAMFAVEQAQYAVLDAIVA
jgi:hypothetical protein